MISFRLLKNYEYVECASSTASSILDLALDAGISITSQTLGQCISKIWNTKVKSVRRNSPKILCYDNLALRAHDWEPITELNESSLAKITAVCLKHHGWFVASSSFDDQRVMLMKEQTTDEVRVETRRLTFQITVELGSEEVLKFSTYGHELSLSHICTLLCDDSNVSCSAIDVLITFLETATPCLGQPVPEDTNEYLKVPVCNSRVTSVTIPGTATQEARLVSLSCTFLSYSRPNLITNVISCHECSKIHRLFRKREQQREKNMASGSQVLHDFKLN